MFPRLNGNNLITGNGSEVINNGSVIVEEGVIKYAGPCEDAPEYDKEVNVIDFGDYYILPGLINTHTHLTFSASRTPRDDLLSESDEFLSIRGATNARRLLESGVTTALDCGAPGETTFEVRKAQKEGLISTSRLYLCGRPITTTGGHLAWMGEIADNSLEIKKSVRKLVGEGVDAIKVMVTGGQMTPNTLPETSYYTLDELETVASEAHKFGMVVVAHCLGTDGIEKAAIAGIDKIEHCAFFTPRGDEGYFRKYSQKVVNKIIDSGSYVTFGLSAGYLRNKELEREAARGVAGAKEELNWRKEEQGQMLEIFRRMSQAGVKMALGTDAGVTLTPFDDTYRELHLMNENGMPPEEVIQAATKNAARSIGKSSFLGTIEPTKRADIIGVKTNPLEDISALAEVSFVMRDGEVIRKDCN